MLMAKKKQIGENSPSLMRHIYKRFFSKIEELRNVTLALGRGGI
jgi:hypothetical protein